jgi:hypothetical protein
MKEINQGNHKPEKVVTVGDFFTQVFLPYLGENRRPSTAKGICDYWQNHLQPRLADVLLRDVRTHDIKRVLDAIASQDKHPKTGQPLRRETLKRVKSCLSAAFKHAKNWEYFEGINPVRDAEIPAKALASQQTYALLHRGGRAHARGGHGPHGPDHTGRSRLDWAATWRNRSTALGRLARWHHHSYPLEVEPVYSCA